MTEPSLHEPHTNGGQTPLISALVIAYNNSDFIFDTLQSVLTQDYPNIELIVSDDHSAKGFPADEIIDYINKHRGENIQRVLINENEENMGTVRHLEKIRAMSRGEYELLIAADDVWKNACVFSDFMAFVNGHKDENVDWVVSQLEMCDEQMNFDRLFMSENTVALLERGDMDALREEIASVAILPSAGCMYRRSFFDKIGSLSAYSLIEDYSAHVRALRMNIRPFYLPRVTARHRGGGVSHGNRRYGQDVYCRYIRDYILIFENEIMPYRRSFSSAAFRRAKRLYDYNRSVYSGMRQNLEKSGAACRMQAERDQSLLDPGGVKRKVIGMIYCHKDSIIRFSLKQKIVRSFLQGTLFLLLSLLFGRLKPDWSALCGALLLLGGFEYCAGAARLFTNIAIQIRRARYRL